MHGHRTLRLLAPLAPALLVSSVCFLSAFPVQNDANTPLPWDMAHHYLGAQEFRDAARSGSAQQLQRSLLARDLYPPGHSVLLGSWLLLFGESALSLRSFQLSSLLICVLALWACAASLEPQRRLAFFIFSSGGLLAVAPILSLAGSFMVEIPAVGLALLGLAAAARADLRPSRASACVGGVLLTAALLTKYNIGLPLVLAVGCLGALRWVQGNRRNGRVLLGLSLGAGLSMALFLCLQSHGWTSFHEFARNRANSDEASIIERGRWYVDLFARRFLPHPMLLLPVLAGALLAWRRRDQPLVALSGGYVAVASFALVNHPYLLSRNLVGPAAMVASLAATGFAFVIPRAGQAREFSRVGGAAVVLALCLGTAAAARSIDEARALGAAMSNGSRPTLSELSSIVQEWLEGDTDVRVFGSFNGFSPGWVKILHARARPGDRPALRADLSYPLPRERTGRDVAPHPEYARQLESWLRGQPEPLAITIEILEGSAWLDDDYRRWGQWRQNYMDELARHSAAILLDERRLLDAGIRARLYRIDPAAIRFGDGWGCVEPWGRWALDARAELRLPAGAAPRWLRLEIAAWDEQRAPTELTIRGQGEPLTRLRVDGRPWQWREHIIELPASHEPLELELEFDARWPDAASGGRQRALPFRRVQLIEIPQPASVASN